MNAELRKHLREIGIQHKSGRRDKRQRPYGEWSKVENGRPKGLFLHGWLGWKHLPGDGSLAIAVP